MNSKTLNKSNLLYVVFTLITLSSFAQNSDSLDLIENPLYYEGFDTVTVQKMISGRIDSNIVRSDTTIYGRQYKNHIEYLGSFTTTTGARYKLVRFITCNADETPSLSCSPIFHKVLVFDNGNELIGFYEILQGTELLMELDNGKFVISPHPRNYDCNIPYKGVTSLKERFPINLNACACVHRDNEGKPVEFNPIYFMTN